MSNKKKDPAIEAFDEMENPLEEEINEELEEIIEEQKKDDEKDIAHDEEFMDSISEQPKKKMSPEQARKRRDFILSEIPRIEAIIAEKEKVAQLSDHPGMNIILSALQQGTCDDIMEMDTDNAKKALKDLEAIKTFKKLTDNYRVSIVSLKADINSLRKELDTLNEIQLTFNDQPANETSGEEELTQEEKANAAADAEIWNPEDCEDCGETECANNEAEAETAAV